ncbi:MAG: hypothetical protein LBQ35_04280 [Spirochaetaceae bacterium]|jgi:hypothetical protein|nr:hypothetical protein [Spirochaetaceae bacterium]
MKGRNSPSSRMVLLGGLLLITSHAAAQELSLEEMFPGLRDRALVLDIEARVVGAQQEVDWNEENSQVTIPGRPVGIKLVGTNVVVAVQFTPYRRNGQNFLVAQGQVWIDVPNQGISYHTSIETIPLEFGESVYFFPLGRGSSPEGSRIEIRVAMRPYVPETTTESPAFAGGQDPAAPAGTGVPAGISPGDVER